MSSFRALFFGPRHRESTSPPVSGRVGGGGGVTENTRGGGGGGYRGSSAGQARELGDPLHFTAVRQDGRGGKPPPGFNNQNFHCCSHATRRNIGFPFNPESSFKTSFLRCPDDLIGDFFVGLVISGRIVCFGFFTEMRRWKNRGTFIGGGGVAGLFGPVGGKTQKPNGKWKGGGKMDGRGKKKIRRGRVGFAWVGERLRRGEGGGYPQFGKKKTLQAKGGFHSQFTKKGKGGV